MRILHYSLGFPPYRSGGLTKFCTDLMKEQVKEGHEAALLWPGEMQIFSSKTRIRRGKDVDRIANYEVINPAPVSYDEGIENIEAFESDGDITVYLQFLKDYKPDVIHVHTFMGLHKNFIIAAKKLNIRTVFTTHDFFPICPKVTLFRDNCVCTDKKCSGCPSCNVTALSLKKIQLLQSPLYRSLKDSYAVKKLRKRHRDNYFDGSLESKAQNNILAASEDYLHLREYYKSLFDLFDFVHYNSSVAKSVYDEYFGERNGKIIAITHSDILDRRKVKNFSGNNIRISYLGNQGAAKGFFRLKAALDEVWKVRQDLTLNVCFHSSDLPPYIRQHGRYSYDQLEAIMDNTDVVIAPSAWYETFGYTVAEALSFGVPVIVSDHVGAKDIVPDGGGMIFHDDNELYRLLIKLSAGHLAEMNKSILANYSVINEADMCSGIMKYGYGYQE